MRTVFDVYGHLLPDADEALVDALDALGRKAPNYDDAGISRVYKLPKQFGAFE